MNRLLTLFLLISLTATALSSPHDPTEPRPGEALSFRLERTTNVAADPSLALRPLQLPPLKERLLINEPRREDTFGNSRVDQAPKSWPYPMVISPSRPVLPGSAW